MSALTLSSPVSVLKGVGEVRRKALSRLGIECVDDLIRHYPRAYQNRGDTKNLSEVTARLSGDVTEGIFSVFLTVATQPTARMIRRGMNILKFRAFDEYGTVEITYFNQNYLKEVFSVGATFRFWGKIERVGRSSLSMTSPIYEPADGSELENLVPVYPLSSGISQKFISGIIRAALDGTEDLGDGDVFTPDMCREFSIEPLSSALKLIHAPKTLSDVEAAKRRLCFEEVFMTSAALAYERRAAAGKFAPRLSGGDISRFVSSLPFELTEAQKRSLGEIAADMASGEPMRRILIGDVGSGKTAVAEGAAYICAKNGYQCAVMVPTEILAEQHYREFKQTLEPLGINVALLCGSMPQSEKARVAAVLSGERRDMTGGIDVVVGTHALISDNVSFERAGLVITDEQHRFGVMQRASLADRTGGVHVLAMSATPIPRTLSLVYYGDLALSRLDEMPPGRQRVDTYVVDERYRDRINKFIRTHARAGNRAYVVCPMIEENQTRGAAYAEKLSNDPEEMADVVLLENEAESAPLKSTSEFARELALRLPDLRIGMINGKMKSAQKDAVMKQFCEGELDVLVSTTVIEVGVNVPEATLMIVENAERYGLSQLHQLRGRVGRGDKKSFCILVSDSKNPKSKERLSVMTSTYDGFEIAERDLKLRGAGDFFSQDGRIRQHGDAQSMLTGSDADRALAEDAVRFAQELISKDPELSLPGHERLRERIERLRAGIDNTIN